MKGRSRLMSSGMDFTSKILKTKRAIRKGWNLKNLENLSEMTF